MTHAEIMLLFLALGTLLLAAKAAGEAARRFGQPVVLGEILAGIVLGPTVIGAFWPEGFKLVFETGRTPLLLQAVTIVAIALFLLVAGMELDLAMVRRH